MEIGFWHWFFFLLFLVVMLALDLGIFNRKKHEIHIKEALIWSGVWISLALIFNLGVFYLWDHHKALEFFTGYILEKSLSVDNIFVFILLFRFFDVPKRYQHKVLYWGIFGALIMRAVLIVIGAALIVKFWWVMLIFGAFLIVAGLKMAFQKDEAVHPEKNPVVKFVKRFLPVTQEYHRDKFFIKKNGLYATPLLIVMIVVETSDLVFALDSIPAILAITHDTFIVFTSNALAILGLRALYFALSGVMDKFYYLKTGLSVILVFIGMKMLLSGVLHISTLFSLLVIVAILVVSVIASLVRTKRLT
ncbi:MAG: TerC family protein [Bacteroidetes bacterium]|nr:TerC family protein [Bacteroidota bacterium]